MTIGDIFGKLTVMSIVHRQKKDGTEGAPLLVDVKCECGSQKTVAAKVLTGTNPQQSCGGKGCRTKRPSQPKPAREPWVCVRRGTADPLA